MSDLIDREKLIFTLIFSEKTKSIFVKDLRSVIEVVNEMPSAEPERNKGKWVEYKTFSRGYGQIYYQHDCCSNLYESPYHFCPNCGAEMRGE